MADIMLIKLLDVLLSGKKIRYCFAFVSEPHAPCQGVYCFKIACKSSRPGDFPPAHKLWSIYHICKWMVSDFLVECKS